MLIFLSQINESSNKEEGSNIDSWDIAKTLL